MEVQRPLATVGLGRASGRDARRTGRKALQASWAPPYRRFRNSLGFPRSPTGLGEASDDASTPRRLPLAYSGLALGHRSSGHFGQIRPPNFGLVGQLTRKEHTRDAHLIPDRLAWFASDQLCRLGSAEDPKRRGRLQHERIAILRKAKDPHLLRFGIRACTSAVRMMRFLPDPLAARVQLSQLRRAASLKMALRRITKPRPSRGRAAVADRPVHRVNLQPLQMLPDIVRRLVAGELEHLLAHT